MLGKNKIKFIQSLKIKKIREQEKLFLIEGDKIVLEAIDSKQDIRLLCATESFMEDIDELGIGESICVTEQELQKASLMQSPQNALAVVEMPQLSFDISFIQGKLSLALDFVQDPGNLGTIIRLADWFGIRHLLCSENTVDCYNPKTIQASMGSIFRVDIHYLSIPQALDEACQCSIPVYGTFLEGESIYDHPLSESGILVMGNEGNGISVEVAERIPQRLLIPPFNQKSSESLNVATAAAICCSEFRRRNI